jgi:hypothetical protein
MKDVKDFRDTLHILSEYFNENRVRGIMVSISLDMFSRELWRETAGQELSVNQLARAFEYHAARIKVALGTDLRSRKAAFGIRHSAFDDDSEDEILTRIEV